MNIVINISDADYKSITEDYISYADTESGRVFKAIKEGTVLPEHHGALKDINDIHNVCKNYTDHDAVGLILANREDLMPTILEATEGEENADSN